MGRTANGYRLLGTGPLQTHITHGLADAMRFLSSTPTVLPIPIDFSVFQLHSLQYAQLAVSTHTPVPDDPPLDVSVFSLRTVCTPDPSGRFQNGVTTHFVWSPLQEEWLVQVKTQARQHTLTYKLVSPSNRVLLLSSSSHGGKLRVSIDGERPFDVVSNELQCRLFHECTLGMPPRCGLPLRPAPAPVPPPPPPRSEPAPSVASVAPTSQWGADEAEEDDGIAMSGFLFEDLDECITYRLKGKKKEKVVMLNAIVVEHEILRDGGLSSFDNILMKRMVDPSQALDVVLPPGATAVPEGARTISAWLCTPSNMGHPTTLRAAFCTQGLAAELGFKLALPTYYPWQMLLNQREAKGVDAITGFGYACGEDKIIYANVAIIPGAAGEWDAVSHSSLKLRFNPATLGNLALGVDRMPTPLIVPREHVPHIANMFFSSIVPHCLKNNWVPAALGIVHIAVMGRLFHSITARDGAMSGMLLLYGKPDTGKSATMRFAECLHGHSMMLGAKSTYAAVNVRMKQMGGLSAVCWDDFTADMWEKEMGAIARSTAGGADSVKINTHGTYNATNYSTLAISVRFTIVCPRHVHSPTCGPHSW